MSVAVPVESIDLAEDTFTPTAGQTVFATSESVTAGGLNFLFVNGVVYEITIDYTAVGTTLTWLNNLFVLETDDRVLFKYEAD